MAQAILEDPQLVRNGKKLVQIKGKTGLQKFFRQALRGVKNGKKKIIIPINFFFRSISQGQAFVSQNLEKEALEKCLKQSYRKCSQSIQNKLSKETVRRRVFRKKTQAEQLEKTATNQQLAESQLKDTDNNKTSYKQSQGGILRKLFGQIFERSVLYFMADGVGVEQQTKLTEKLGKRECKVATFLRQTGEKVEQIATFCTWKRVTQFTAMVEWVLLGIFPFGREIIIISDGAKWIRNLRGSIPSLKKAVWILDWFHLKDRTLKLFLKFELTESSELTQTAISLCWYGKAVEALAFIKKLPLSADPTDAEQQIQAIKKYEIYLHNQREGIINYQAYKMKGYLVGSGCVEKINDQLVKDRMVRQGRMRWGIEGGEAMMQLLTAKYNGRLDELFS